MFVLTRDSFCSIVKLIHIIMVTRGASYEKYRSS